MIATSPHGEDVVYQEGQLHAQVIDRADHVRQMVEVWESIRGEGAVAPAVPRTRDRSGGDTDLNGARFAPR
ncbi:hypothetical protein [Micromonospora sp. NPDC049282]|uniref:hypothetical protein n=1 Tax=Micromonospora sp. NPDC049282 TaxID=3364269 RepID=UPI00371623D3